MVGDYAIAIIDGTARVHFAEIAPVVRAPQ
jgi:hypothetical protein